MPCYIKLQPEDFRDCYDSYNNPKYDNMKLVPHGLKKHVFNTTSDEELRTALRPSILNNSNSFSDLPSGLRGYIRSNPSEFASYVEERKQELRLLRSVLRNMPVQEKQRLRAYFAQHKNIPLKEFSQIIRGDRPGVKRGRGMGPPTKNVLGGCKSVSCTCSADSSSDWDAESVFTSLTSEGSF